MHTKFCTSKSSDEYKYRYHISYSTPVSNPCGIPVLIFVTLINMFKVEHKIHNIFQFL